MKLKYVFLVGFLFLVLINSCSNNNKIVYNNVIASAHPLASLSGKKNV
jgi:hypothetical protein